MAQRRRSTRTSTPKRPRSTARSRASRGVLPVPKLSTGLVPRPIRHQGVFVSDREIAAVVKHWCDQVEDPRYDTSITSLTGEAVGNVAELADDDADRLLMDAVGVIREYDRASASLLQRRLRIGYARAARIIDQLEARGYIGAFDGSSARVVLRRDDDGGYDEADDD